MSAGRDQEWLRGALDSLGEAVIAADPEGRLLFLNREAQQLAGRRGPDVLGQPWDHVFRLVQRPSGQPLAVATDRVLEEGTALPLPPEAAFLTPDGAPRPVEGRLAPLLDTGGRRTGFLLVLREPAHRAPTVQALETQAQRQAAILEGAIDAIVTMDAQGCVVEFNAAAERLFGYRRADVLGKDLADHLIPAACRSGHRTGVTRQLAGAGLPLGRRIEVNALRADGSEFPVELTLTRIPTPGPPLFTAYLRDLTPRQHAERCRAARLAVAQALAEAGDLAGAAPRVLQAVCESLQWPAGEFWVVDRAGTGLRCLGLWHAPDLDLGEFATLTLQGAFAPGIGLPGRIWAQREPAWIRDLTQDANFPRAAAAARAGLRCGFGCPIRLGGEVQGVLGFYTPQPREPDPDLLEMLATVGGQVALFLERRQAEDRLREESRIAETLNRVGRTLTAELDLQRLVQALTDEATRLADAQFGAFFYNVKNDQGESYLLYTLSGVPREAFARFPMPRNTPIFEPTFRGQGVVRLEDVTKDPRFGQVGPHHGMPAGHLPVRAYLAVPVVARTGEVLGGLFLGHTAPGVFTDRHERLIVGVAAQAAVAIDNARLYAEVRDAARRKDEFLAMLAHELRNPLAPIRNALHILKARHLDPATVGRARDVLDRQVQHLVRLVDDLLDVSRLLRGKIELRPEGLELAALVARAVETAQPVLDARGHQLVVSLPPQPVRLQGDLVRLAQVINNLLTNAAKYTDRGGRITLTGGREGDQVVITVRDPGIGIAPELLPRIFDLFVQGDPLLVRNAGGLGIGLTLVKNLVELHGGTVTAASAGPGKGSAFTVRLPALPAGAEPEGPHGAAAEAAPCRVLVVDDNVDAAESLALLLQLLGHEVKVAHDGPTALELAPAFRPHLALLDIGMPGMDGLELARRLRPLSGLETTVLAALTGWGQEDDRRRTREAGFTYHLVKPADPQTLKELLAGVRARETPPPNPLP